MNYLNIPLDGYHAMIDAMILYYIQLSLYSYTIS